MGGLCDGDPEESFQALMDLDVCIYYTLEEIKQNQSHFVSRTPLEKCFVFLLVHVSQNRCRSHRKVG